MGDGNIYSIHISRLPHQSLYRMGLEVQGEEEKRRNKMYQV
jgi:hypothetical protein